MNCMTTIYQCLMSWCNRIMSTILLLMKWIFKKHIEYLINCKNKRSMSCEHVLSRLFYFSSRSIQRYINFVLEWETTKNSSQPIQFLGWDNPMRKTAATQRCAGFRVVDTLWTSLRLPESPSHQQIQLLFAIKAYLHAEINVIFL
jgi:hypothetical protein